jgi:hypothetical protein
LPNIPVYTSTGTITPSDKGINAATDAARHYARVGDSIGRDVNRGVQKVADAVERHMTLMESSELLKTNTELKINVLRQYKEQSDLPENRANPHFGDTFYEGVVKPAYEAWGNSVGTPQAKDLAMRLKAAGLNDVFGHIAAGQADIDYTRTLQNHDQNIALIGASFENDVTERAAAVAISHAADDRNVMLSSVSDVGKREELRRQFEASDSERIIVDFYKHRAAAVKLQVAQTGDETQSPAYAATEETLASQFGFEHLGRVESPGTKIRDMMDQAVAQGKELFRAKDATLRRNQDEAVQGAVLEAETSMFKSNGAGGVTVVSTPDLLDAMQRIAQMPGAERHGDDVRALGNALHTATQSQIDGKERATDQGTYMALFERVGSTTNPLTKAEVDLQVKKLSDKDWQFLRTSAADSKLAEPKVNHAMTELNQWLATIKPGIVKSNMYGGITPDSALQYSAFAWKAQDRVRKAIAAGYAPEDVVKILTNPANHLGLYRDMQPYMMTNKQGLQGVLEATKPGGGGTLPNLGGVGHTLTLPRKPGESMEDYDKRKGH